MLFLRLRSSSPACPHSSPATRSSPAAWPARPLGGLRNTTPLRECLEAGQRLGASTLVAVHLSDVPLDIAREAEAFAALCDQAAEYGLRVGLEPVAFGGVPDLGTANRIVAAAGHANGGFVVDLWHHVRSSNDPAALNALPADRVYTVQFSDGPAQAPADLVEEARYHRQWPGEGAFGVTAFLRLLDSMGVRAAVGAELYQPWFQEADPDEVVARIAASSRAALRAAGIEIKG